MTVIRNIVRRRGPFGPLADRVEHRMHLVGDRLFRVDAATAREHGWQIEVHRAGLARQYRDSRFDALVACLGCRGAGRDGEQTCPVCVGTGRIVLEQAHRRGQR
jgi:hypothetical protein